MTFDEIKSTLFTSHDEGVDTAAAYDAILTEVSAIMSNLDTKVHEVEDLTNRLAESTASNMKLLDKVKYMLQNQEDEPVNETETITLTNLFEEA